MILKNAKNNLINDNNKFARNFISFVYNCLFSFNMYFIIPKNKIIFTGAFIRNTKIIIHGQNNVIRIEPLTRLENCKIVILGNNSKIELGRKCILKKLKMCIEDDSSFILVGAKTTIEGGEIAATEGEGISIGVDCMFAHNIEIRNGDSHSIIDNKTQLRFNFAKRVLIGNHVWLGGNVIVLKGSVIEDGTIIGTGSVVTGKLDNNCIYVGNPAKKIKENTTWLRNRIKN